MPNIAIAAGVTFDCAETETILHAGLRAGLGMPYECNVGSCGTCKIGVDQGTLASSELPAPGLSERDKARGRALACQARPLSDCVIRVHLEDRYIPRYRPIRQRGLLEAIEPVTSDISSFTFRTPMPARFIAGQYALLRLPGIGNHRVFSMANLPNDDGLWQFMIRAVPGGAASAYLFERRQLGDIAEIDGPYGVAYYKEHCTDVVCIAGGSGIAPALSVARAAAQDKDCQRIVFFYGGRTPGDLCAEGYLSKLTRQNLSVRCHGIVSDIDVSSSLAWSGPKGLVHEYLERTLSPEVNVAEFYVAGPPAMVEAVENVLANRCAVPRERIHYDRFY
jgi:toluene monooxygenase electron transfer component